MKNDFNGDGRTDILVTSPWDGSLNRFEGGIQGATKTIDISANCEDFMMIISQALNHGFVPG